MLKELEITGFKSFAKKAVLEFRTSISAIVGPNGSGKSNVAESLRFVLGEQSIKSMRGKKGEDLIFNGSTGAPRANRAAVKIVFDNRNKVFDVDYDEVSIERVVHRDGTNEYFINGSIVRLKDVIEILSKANIGASGHHIISQGEADRILSVSPKERKSMIEDALGLKIYQYKKEESERKLLKTEENIKQVESLRREIAPHLKFLKKQVEKLEKLQSMKDALVGQYLEYFKREDAYLRSQKERIESSLRAPKQELDILEQKLREAKEVLESDKNSENMDELGRLAASLEEARANVSRIGREYGRLEGEISSLEKNLERQREYIERQETTTVPLTSVKELEENVQRMAAGVDGMADISLIKKLVLEIRDMLSEFVKRSSKSSSTENEIIRTGEVEVATLREKKERIRLELEQAENDEQSALSIYNQKRDAVEREKDTYKDAEKNVYRIMARQNELFGIVNSLRQEEGRLEIERVEYESELNEAVILVGPEAIRFDALVLRDGERMLTNEDIISEERQVQEQRKKEIEKIKIRLEDNGVSGGDDLLKEYNETTDRDAFLERELNDLTLSAESLKNLINELQIKLGEEFQLGVSKINKEFNKFFGMMFGGGQAGLSVILQSKRKRKDTDIEIDEVPGEDVVEDETEEGLEVTVSLPHKKIKGLMMLSGGERALTSIALLFAISQVNPPPFIVLDETDAALDEANSRKYADMVKALADHSQVILITHNRETMNAAGVLYGVTMGSDGVSKLLSVSFDEATNFAK